MVSAPPGPAVVLVLTPLRPLGFIRKDICSPRTPGVKRRPLLGCGAGLRAAGGWSAVSAAAETAETDGARGHSESEVRTLSSAQGAASLCRSR